MVQRIMMCVHVLHLEAGVCNQCAPTQAALRMLYDRGSGLKCYQAPLEALYHGDAGVALQLLHAGFNMASLMARYQGVDWRITATWNCNDGWVTLAVNCAQA